MSSQYLNILIFAFCLVLILTACAILTEQYNKRIRFFFLMALLAAISLTVLNRESLKNDCIESAVNIRDLKINESYLLAYKIPALKAVVLISSNERIVLLVRAPEYFDYFEVGGIYMRTKGGYIYKEKLESIDKEKPNGIFVKGLRRCEAPIFYSPAFNKPWLVKCGGKARAEAEAEIYTRIKKGTYARSLLPERPLMMAAARWYAS